MAAFFGGYEQVSRFTTAGSGSARWCFVTKDGRKYVMKEFLSPLSPAPDMVMTPDLRTRRTQRSQAFEDRKKRLYGVLYGIHNPTLVPVVDFFRSEGRYYAISERIEPPYLTGAQLCELPRDVAMECLRQLTACLMQLREHGVVHADLKPEHLLLTPTKGGVDRLRLIDFDNGFFEDEPPAAEYDIAGDPVYLAPETFLCMIGRPTAITHKADVFALGIILHWMLTGELPAMDERYTYLYEAVLDGGEAICSRDMPVRLRSLLRAMLQARAEDRPSYEEVLDALSEPDGAPAAEAQVNEAAASPFSRPSSSGGYRPFDRSGGAAAPMEAPDAETVAPTPVIETPSPFQRPATTASSANGGKPVNGLSKYMRPLPFGEDA